MSSEPAVPRCTHPSNANKHPGQIVLQAKGHQRTAEEITTAKATKATKATAVQVGIQCLAEIELAMEENQANTLTRKAKSVWPPPKAKSKAISEKEKAFQHNAAWENNTNIEDVDDGPSKRKKKKVIRESISEARDEINRSSHCDGSSDSKVPLATCVDKGSENTFASVFSSHNFENPKFTLGGKVQNWISGIDTLPKPQAIKTHSSASIPPSTLFSHLTKTSKVTIQSVISAEATDKAGDVLVGGFDDDEPEDDSLECQMAQSTVEKGRRAVTNTVALTLDDSDNASLYDVHTRPPFTQSSKLRAAPHPRPITKRKASDTLEPLSGSEIEDFDAASDISDFIKDISMDIDSPQADIDPNLYQVKEGPPSAELMSTLSQKASHTTSLTSVKTTDTNVKTPAVYPELILKNVQNGVIFLLTVQCLSEWLSNFGSTAIALIIDFLTSNKDSNLQVLACILFKDYAFLYADMDLCDPLGVYHSAFMLQLFRKVHLAIISGHTNVPVLKTHVLASGGMIGAISLCAAALKRAVKMTADGDIKAEDVLASASSSKINIKLPKILNKLTGKETSAPFLFSHDRCTKKTKNYAKSIKNKGPAFISLLTEIACSALKEDVSWDSPATDNKSDDERALLHIYVLLFLICVVTQLWISWVEFFDGPVFNLHCSCKILPLASFWDTFIIHALLIHFILLSFAPHHSFLSHHREHRAVTFPDNWVESDITLDIPTKLKDDLSRSFSIPGFHYWPLVAVIRSIFTDIQASAFHLFPFKHLWKDPLNGHQERMFDELYSSDSWLEAQEELQRQPREHGCSLKRMIAGLMLFSDATHLANFGMAKAWPLYLYFGNLTKYACLAPKSGACHLLRDNIKDVLSTLPWISKSGMAVLHALKGQQFCWDAEQCWVNAA
ncbi:hypothetical protein BD769DRAFT_1676420 [Suillus cothurnatus]|nr:hypothetical protein BD769DRAFT_1676420 [Suillus cothurnatus]